MKKQIKYLLAILVVLLLSQITFAEVQKNTAEDIRDQAKILYMGNKIIEAQKHILTIPDEERNSFDYFLMGLTEKTPEEAIKAYEKSISLDEKYYQTYFNIASLYFNEQNYEKAIQYYKLAIKHNKKFDYGYYNLGCSYLKIEDYNNARKSFESAIKINPKEPDYYFNLGYTHKKMNNTKRADKALNLYNELMSQRNSN